MKDVGLFAGDIMQVKLTNDALLRTISQLETELAVAKAKAEPARVSTLTKYIKDDVQFWHLLSLGFMLGGMFVATLYEFFVL